MVARLGLEDRMLIGLYTFSRRLKWCVPVSGSLQTSRFTITADAYQSHYQ